jgi:hypothetical protein
VGLGDAEVGEQERDRLGRHRGAAVGVQGQLVAVDLLLADCLGDQRLGQHGGLAGGDHPADRVAGEDVEDHVEVVVGPLRRPVQLGDIPTPHGVRRRRDQLGLHLRRMGGKAASVAGLAAFTQQPVHRRLRAQVDALIQQVA